MTGKVNESPDTSQPLGLGLGEGLGPLVEAAGMVNVLNHGSGSLVYSEGCHGVTQEHLERFAELVRADERHKLCGQLGALPERAGWTRDRPNAGGRWMWASGGLAPVALRLTASGAEVAPPDDEDLEGTPQYYWEQTPTDQKHMPGWWKRA